MTKRTHVKINDENVDGKLVNKAQMLVDLIRPKDLYFIGGRALAKTSGIVSQRSQHVCNEMPGCYSMFVADTYMNALTNVLPALIDGWQRMGWREGIHFVTDKRPPSHFKLPYKPPLHYKHTISIYTGNIFNLGSLDQPSGLAGGSYQHRFGDEARLLKKKKLDRSTPALRGEFVRFGHSPLYMGNTFTTDMPNLLTTDDDWILQMEKEMDSEQIELALQAALVLNDIKKEMLSYEQKGITSERSRLEKSYRHWNEYYTRIRKDSTFFYAVSSLVNLDNLTDNYFKSTLKALGPEEFRSAILSFKINVSKGEKFYSHLGEHHFFDDGTDISYFDKFSIFDTIKDSCKSMSKRYYDIDSPLECGVDFGDMSSMVTGQRRGNYLYALKEFYTLHPEDEMTLGAKFREFYQDHKYKILYMYYDRAGNQNAKMKTDKANYLKNAIEYLPDGSSSGWIVHLMNEFQGNIYQEEEFNLAKQLMGESVPGLPKLRIDKLKCKCLTSSLKLTKIILKTDKMGTRTIHKDKSSEKLPLQSRPMFSTNFSDAFKYWICRPDFFDVANIHNVYSGMDPSVIGR
jgi:hypothetical protein